MTLRSILLFGGVLTLGAAMALVATGDLSIHLDTENMTLPDGFDSEYEDPLTTDERIKSKEDRVSLVTNVTLYESGAAQIYLNEDHGCYDQIEIGHADSDTVYMQVAAPEFSGPVVVDMKRIVQENGPYPDNEFEITLDSTNENCVAVMATDSTTIVVPDSWTNN